MPTNSDAMGKVRRRLSTILSADVVASSRLIRNDEEGALDELRNRLRLIEHIVNQHEGHVFSDTGDGVLAEFASVVDATRCALEIQRQNEAANGSVPENLRIRLRIGLNLGDVLADDRNLRGDGVNVAVRLQSLAEPGTICASSSVHEHIKHRLALRYQDLGSQTLKNISEPVHCYLIREDGNAAGSRPVELHGNRRPTIAILPFSNYSEDPAQAYFSDGITEDIITELSRFRTLVVIARTSSFAYRGKAMTVQSIGHALNAEYLVEGSVRRRDNRLRITAQLLDSQTGGHLWGERYDVAAEDIIAVQDEVVRQVVGALEQRLVMAQLDRSKRLAGNALQAYDYWLRGKHIFSFFSAEAQLEALPCFEKAVELDPSFARAHASLASIYNSISVLNPGSPNSGTNLDRALACARRAVELDPVDARPHIDLGWNHMLRREFQIAARQFDLAGSLNPNDPDVLIARAQAAAFLGNAMAGLPLAQLAIRLNPHHPGFYLYYLATIHCLASQYDEALASLDLAQVALPGRNAWRTVTLAHLGDIAEARRSVQTFIADVRQRWAGDPAAGPREYVDWLFRITPLAKEKDTDLVREGLRLAGLSV